MKKRSLLLSIVALILMIPACISFDVLFPTIQGPYSESASMLILEAGKVESGGSTNLFNSSYTGWAPYVVDSAGKVVPFKAFDTESRLDSFFYSENLEAGEYTLKGFYHVYIDYSRLPADTVALYGPFDNYYYHVKQEFLLDQPVTVKLARAEIATFGRYYIDYQWKDGLAGTTDDRWKVTPLSVKISGDATDTKALRVAKNWRTPNWANWNKRNPEIAADN